MIWRLLNGATMEHLGFLPSFLSEDDPRPAREQIHDNYRHGGGWRPFKGFKFDPGNLSITYPDDPPQYPLATVKLREEFLIFYPHAWLLIMQPSGKYEISRVD